MLVTAIHTAGAASANVESTGCEVYAIPSVCRISKTRNKFTQHTTYVTNKSDQFGLESTLEIADRLSRLQRIRDLFQDNNIFMSIEIS